MKKINILHINHIARTGSGNVIKAITDGLPKTDFSCHTLVWYDFDNYPNTTSLYTTKKSIRYRQIRYKLAVWLNFLFDWMTPGHIDINYLHTYKPYIDCDIVHIHCPQWWYFDWKDLPAISKEKKVIMTIHDDWITSGNDPVNLYYPYKTKAQYEIRRKILAKCSIVYIGVSDRCTDKAKKSWIVAHNIAKTIYNWINTNVFCSNNKIQSREVLWLPLNKRIIISIAGSGSKTNAKWLGYVKKIIKENANSDSLFLTLWNHESKKVSSSLWEIWYVDHTLVAKYFSAADMFLYPTLMDSFGLVVAESIACGCPVVTFETWWVPEIVTHKKNGYIAQYKNYADLLSWFNWVLHNPLDKVTLDPKFTQEHMVKEYIQLYKSQLGLS